MAKHDDRRLHERVIIQVKGTVFDSQTDAKTDVIVHDISDIGISFYVAPSVKLTSHELVVLWDDTINEKPFNISVECSPVRQHNKNGLYLHGCRIVGDSRDFLVYGLRLRLAGKNKKY